MIHVIEGIDKQYISPWGNCKVTITNDVLDELKRGKVLHIDVLDEYSVFISVGDKIQIEVE